MRKSGCGATGRDAVDLKSTTLSETLWVRIPPAASKVVKGSPQNLDEGETIYPHPPLMTDAPEIILLHWATA